MAQVTIQINGREYGIACDDGQEGHIIRLANLLNDKAKLLTGGGAHINENQLLAMVGLLLADELQDAQKGIAAPQTQTIEKIVEKVVEVPVEKIVEKIVEVPVEKIVEVEKESSQSADFSVFDAKIAEQIESVTEQINLLANEIDSW